MAVLADINSRNWPAGENSAEVAIDDSVVAIRVTATRQNWPDTGGNVIELEIWEDTGAGFWLSCACTSAGGDAYLPDGVTITPVTWLEVPITPGTNRSVRAVFRRLVSLRTGITVETV